MINGSTPQPPFGSLEITLSIEEAAESLEVTTEALMRYIRAGELPHLRVPVGDNVEFRILLEDVQLLRARLAPPPDGVAPTSAAGSGVAKVVNAAQAEDNERTKRNEALAKLLEEHDRVLAENARLQMTLRSQSERIAELEAVNSPDPAEAAAGHAELPDWLNQLRSLPAAVEELAAHVKILQEELIVLRDRREQIDQGAFQQAWRRMQRRRWWADLVD